MNNFYFERLYNFWGGSSRNDLAFHPLPLRRTPNMILKQLCLHLGCEYVSDLPFLDGEKHEQLKLLLAQMPHKDTTEQEWDEVYSYLKER